MPTSKIRRLHILAVVTCNLYGLFLQKLIQILFERRVVPMPSPHPASTEAKEPSDAETQPAQNLRASRGSNQLAERAFPLSADPPLTGRGFGKVLFALPLYAVRGRLQGEGTLSHSLTRKLTTPLLSGLGKRHCSQDPKSRCPPVHQLKPSWLPE